MREMSSIGIKFSLKCAAFTQPRLRADPKTVHILSPLPKTPAVLFTHLIHNDGIVNRNLLVLYTSFLDNIWGKRGDRIYTQ